MGRLRLLYRAVVGSLTLAIVAQSGAFAATELPRDDQGLCDSLNLDALRKYEYGSWTDYMNRYPNDKLGYNPVARMRKITEDIEKEPSMEAVVNTLEDHLAKRLVPFAPKAVCFYTGRNATLRNFGLLPPPWISNCEADASTPDSDSLLAVLGTIAPPEQPRKDAVSPFAPEKSPGPDASKTGDPLPGTQGIGTIGFYHRFSPADQKTARIRFAENLWEKYRSCDYQISWLVKNVHGPTDEITNFAWRRACNSWDSENRGFFDDLVNDAEAFPKASDAEVVAALKKETDLDKLNPLPPKPIRPGRLAANFNGVAIQTTPQMAFFREYDLAYKTVTFCASILNRTYPPNTKRFLCNNSNLLGGVMFGAVALLNGKTTSATSTGLATLGGLFVAANPITCASNLGGQGGANAIGGSGTGKGGGAPSPAPKAPSNKPPR